MDYLRERLVAIEERIEAASVRCGRKREEIELLAVTKTLPLACAEDAYALGLRLFGENRVKEAVEKYGNRSGMMDTRLHLIGHLQRNKARDASRFFDCVESIDKTETAIALNAYCAQAGKTMDILLEVNTSGEVSKSGFPDDSALFASIDSILSLSNLRIQGLMTVGPLTDEERIVRASFARLRELFEKLKSLYPELYLSVLSMGMSGDFELAIEEGSTRIRVGTALFGPRTYA